jgi:hypothetical protein
MNKLEIDIAVLSSRFRWLLENERLVVFDLRR